MGFKLLEHIRSKSRRKGIEDTDKYASPQSEYKSKTSFNRTRPNPTAKFPSVLIEELLSYIYPSNDSYASYEDSMTAVGCILCDTRDLAQCALVNRQWSEVSQNLLYHNIRIDAVHYCDRETELAQQRKRRSFAGRNGAVRDPPKERLQLLSRTVRENNELAQKIQYLKTPYMTREGNVADLARTISCLANLVYVDLPEGCYHDESSCFLLKQELQSRCPRIRHMRYCNGSEGSLQKLVYPGQWQDLKSIELSHLALESDVILGVLSSMTSLEEVKLENMHLLDDSLFEPRSIRSFPPVVKLTLQNVPNISAQGLVAYLSRLGSQKPLNHLQLLETGVSASDLYCILLAGTELTSLHISASVSRTLSSSQIPPLASQSLQTLHYEISNASISPSIHTTPSESYYAYLSSSMLSGLLPALSRLYALSDAPQDLLQPAPRPFFSEQRDAVGPPLLSLGITRPLQLYTKAVRELEWNITLISPPSTPHRRGSVTTTRPESLYPAPALSPQYRTTGKQSVIVGNGFGGFLAVPTSGNVPGSPGSKNKLKDVDAWMG